MAPLASSTPVGCGRPPGRALLALFFLLVGCLPLVSRPAWADPGGGGHALYLPVVERRRTTYTPRERAGVAFLAGGGALTDYPIQRLPFGWYADWTFRAAPAGLPGVDYVQTLPVDPDHYPPDWDALRAAVAANPGVLWLVGNEPECPIGQGRRTPAQYAEIYHAYYTFLKAHDATCRVAIGGVVQPTPLRLEWLERALTAYRARYGRAMPVDVWNMHNMILGESSDPLAGGAGIPVGLESLSPAELAALRSKYAWWGTDGLDPTSLRATYQWWDNDSLLYFAHQVRAFRRWMAQQGYRHAPLIISEFGVLYPSSWFDSLRPPTSEERIQAFMTGTFQYLAAATDPALGYPPDGNRLVQRWLWYSLNGPTWEQSPETGFNGNLCDYYTRQLTPFGLHYEALMAGGF